MAVDKTIKIRCDHCGKEAEVSPRHDDIGSVIQEACRESGVRWRRVGWDGIICDDCSKPYDDMLERHKRETEAFLSMR